MVRPGGKTSNLKKSLILSYRDGIFSLGVIFLIVASLCSSSCFHATLGVVAVSNPLAAEAGAKILARGGNAVDAAAGIQFALNVVEPAFSGIGGGGFMMIHLADSNKTFIIDFREKAPAAATPDMFYDGADLIPWDKRISSGIAVGVPGTLMGVAKALERYGTISLAEALKDAIKLAKAGFHLSKYQASLIAQEKTGYQPETAAVFRPAGMPLQNGDLLVQTDLANTFELIAAKGTPVFYQGAIASAIVQAQLRTRAGAAGVGRMTTADLAAYHVVERKPIIGTYRGYTIKTMSPPSSGGLTLIQILKMLERFNLADVNQGFGFGTIKTLHVMIEAMRLAYADRAVWMGDDDFVPIPRQGLLSDEYIAKRSAMIRINSRMDAPVHGNLWQHQSRSFPNDMLPVKRPCRDQEGMQTTHFTVTDRWGNIVACTSTIESTWGTGIMVPGCGFILNNELTDFNPAPAYHQETGNPGANDAAANKRPGSSMAPTMLFKDGKPIATYGSPGGPTIINTVLQITLNLIDHKMKIQEAIDAPRLSVHNASGTLSLLENGFAEKTVQGLLGLGHYFNRDADDVIGSVQAIFIDPVTGNRSGGADMRREGTVIKLRR